MINYIFFQTIDSTNQYLKTHHKTLSDFTLVHANHQTNGKGRMGKIWKDRHDAALFSLLIRSTPPLKLMPEITELVAYSLHRFLSPIVKDIKIKHPNDLMVEGKKLAGILTESIIEGDHVDALIIGIGININNETFDHDLLDIGTSIYLLTKEKMDIQSLIKAFAIHFKSDYEAFIEGHLSIKDYIEMHRYN